MRSKRLNTLVFLLLTMGRLIGQTGERYFSIYSDFGLGDPVFTFLHQNQLKSSPDSNSKTLAVLGVGEKLLIDTTLMERYEEGYVNPLFYRVKYKETTGYMATGSLAVEKLSQGESKISLLFKIVKKDDQDHVLIIKEVHGNATIESEFETTMEGESMTLSMTDTRGLDSIDRLILVDYLAESCGAEGGVTYFSWKPKCIQRIAHLTAVADADVYSVVENLVFPADSGGTRGLLLFQSETYELIDEATNWYATTFVERTYQWVNGKISPEFTTALSEE